MKTARLHLQCGVSTEAKSSPQNLSQVLEEIKRIAHVWSSGIQLGRFSQTWSMPGVGFGHTRDELAPPQADLAAQLGVTAYLLKPIRAPGAAVRLISPCGVS
jgi:hypothetical protein